MVIICILSFIHNVLFLFEMIISYCCVLFDHIIFGQSTYEICTHTGVYCFIHLNVWFWNKDDCDQSGMYETRKQILHKNE